MYLKGLFFVFAVTAFNASINAQFRRIDTTLQVGKAGYKINCNNKKEDKNSVSIKPVGFDKEAREVNVDIRGKISDAEIDDLNGDGFPDLVLYVYNGAGNVFGTVFGISSMSNQSMRPIIFPDITDDAKLKVGYKGHDKFMLMEGTLIRKFPVYNTADSAHIEPSGITRGIQYNVVVGENGQAKFKIMRSYESKN